MYNITTNYITFETAVNCFGHKTTADSKKGLSNNEETSKTSKRIKMDRQHFVNLTIFIN